MTQYVPGPAAVKWGQRTVTVHHPHQDVSWTFPYVAVQLVEMASGHPTVWVSGARLAVELYSSEAEEFARRLRREMEACK